MASRDSASLRQRASSSPSKDETEYLVTGSSNLEDYGTKKLPPNATFLDRLVYRLPSLAWIAAAVLIFVYTDFLYIYSDPHFNMTAAMLASSLYFFVLMTFLYLNVWLPKVMGQSIDYQQWQRTAPRAIPFATMCGTLASIFSIVAIWSVYHLLSIPIFFVLFMAFIVFVSLF